ncbi:hypothetical protein LCGC14_1741110, partial [marine sediment metagenome]
LANRLPEGMKEIVPSNPIKQAVAKIEARQAKEAIELTTGKFLQKPTADPVGDFVKQLYQAVMKF